MPAWSCSPLKCCCWGRVESSVGFWGGLLSPVDFGRVLAVCVLAGSRTHRRIFPPARSDPALLYFHVFTCVYPASPAWAAGLPWGVGGAAGVVAAQLLKGRMVWELDHSSIHLPVMGSPGDPSFLPSPSLPPLGNACVDLSNFPISASTVLPFEGSYWVVVIILLQLPQARTLKPAASSDVKKDLCALGTSFAVIACGLRSILPPCKSFFALLSR